MLNFFSNKKGFSIMELLIYIGIFTVSAVFLIAILTVVTRIQSRQSSNNQLNQQVGFVNDIIQQLVRDSSLIDINPGVATSSLVLRMASSTLDPTTVYSSSGIIYMSQAGSVYALTDSSVKVDNFTVTKYENPGSMSLVEIDLAISYNSPKPEGKISRSLKTVIGRISAATFDSSVLPVGSGLNIGGAGSQWTNGYFSGDLDISGRVGIGITPPTGGSSFRLRTPGDVGFTVSGAGPVLRSPGGVCWRLGITNVGGFTTTSVACP